MGTGDDVDFRYFDDINSMFIFQMIFVVILRNIGTELDWF